MTTTERSRFTVRLPVHATLEMVAPSTSRTTISPTSAIALRVEAASPTRCSIAPDHLMVGGTVESATECRLGPARRGLERPRRCPARASRVTPCAGLEPTVRISASSRSAEVSTLLHHGSKHQTCKTRKRAARLRRRSPTARSSVQRQSEPRWHDVFRPQPPGFVYANPGESAHLGAQWRRGGSLRASRERWVFKAAQLERRMAA